MAHMSYIGYYGENSWAPPCLGMNISDRYLAYLGQLTWSLLETAILRQL